VSAGERSRIGYCQQCIPERESDIQAAIKDYLGWHGWFCWKVHQSLGSFKGVSDLIAVKNGKVLFIEVKTSTGRLGVHQQAFRDELTRHGGTYIVARSVEDVREAMARLTWGSPDGGDGR